MEMMPFVVEFRSVLRDNSMAILKKKYKKKNIDHEYFIWSIFSITLIFLWPHKMMNIQMNRQTLLKLDSDNEFIYRNQASHWWNAHTHRKREWNIQIKMQRRRRNECIRNRNRNSLVSDVNIWNKPRTQFQQVKGLKSYTHVNSAHIVLYSMFLFSHCSNENGSLQPIQLLQLCICIDQTLTSTYIAEKNAERKKQHRILELGRK